LRPFGRRAQAAAFDAAGLWLSAGGGAAYTGDLLRPVVGVRLGFDLFAARDFRLGPSAGFLQIVETTSVVMPEDARLVLVGLHAAFEARVPRPLADRDRDGIGDDRDLCPDVPEDFDNFEDEDGCPEIDNDNDRVLDAVDSCPNDPEDHDGFEDHDGCPDKDNDQDGVLDVDDKCPDIAEDIDGFEDDDGCPDHDNDQDGFGDAVDKCPNEPETVNDYADDDGCPDGKLVRVRGDEILIDDRIYFRTNMDQIRVRSWPLLEMVAKLLKSNPQYERVSIQGHADQRGAERFNKQLSLRRGQAVREMLIKYGVAPARLVVEGFGETRPSREGDTEYAWRKNRRVEIRIIQRGDGILAPSGPADE
jgi:outer membrane protein OmpA-like peptidoglycan-associated protein